MTLQMRRLELIFGLNKRHTDKAHDDHNDDEHCESLDSSNFKQGPNSQDHNQPDSIAYLRKQFEIILIIISFMYRCLLSIL